MKLSRIDAGLGAPRLRTLAKHLVADRPWLMISDEDQQLAINLAFRSRYDVSKSELGSSCFRAVGGFEQVLWSDFEPPHFTDEQRRRGEDSLYREINRDAEIEGQKLEGIVKIGGREIRTGIDEATARRVALATLGNEILPVRIRWANFNNAEIVEDFAEWLEVNRPKEWPELERRGRKKETSYYAALRQLAAMRLCYAYKPAEAFRVFSGVYRRNQPIDSPTAERNFRQMAKDAREQVLGLFFLAKLLFAEKHVTRCGRRLPKKILIQ